MNPPAKVERAVIPLGGELASVCLRSFLAAVPNLVYFKDRNSRFIAVSHSKAARHALEPAEMLGKTDADFFTAESAQWRRVDEESIMAMAEPVIDKLEQVTWRDGREGWVQTTKCPLRDDDGDIFGTLGFSYDVTTREALAHDLEKTRRDLLDASRVAGMAEVATGVLHNVGNVLTSLNVSTSLLTTGLRYSKAESLARVAQLLHEHGHDLPEFITKDPKGRLIPEYIVSLAQHLTDERDRLLNELAAMQQNIDHIKDIVTMQQSYATMAGVVEPLSAVDLVEDAVRMNTGTLLRHSVSVVREFHPVPRIRAEKGKVLQILVNLIRNAKYACDDLGAADKIITLRIAPGTVGRVQIVVQDNGIGIPAENIERIFQHGFTTRSQGHGFGLHSARNAATTIDGSITVVSDGIGKGATFTLDLPEAN